MLRLGCSHHCHHSRLSGDHRERRTGQLSPRARAVPDASRRPDRHAARRLRASISPSARESQWSPLSHHLKPARLLQADFAKKVERSNGGQKRKSKEGGDAAHVGGRHGRGIVWLCRPIRLFVSRDETTQRRDAEQSRSAWGNGKREDRRGKARDGFFLSDLRVKKTKTRPLRRFVFRRSRSHREQHVPPREPHGAHRCVFRAQGLNRSSFSHRKVPSPNPTNCFPQRLRARARVGTRTRRRVPQPHGFIRAARR
mmetsp:Transcript_160/g.553  ORF Transcript_160/g.553 Transcript_160/m.553 type:complete len:255 (+) Transcript_160:2093-2857(+)